MLDLFSDERPWQEPLAKDALILHRYALDRAACLLAVVDMAAQTRPFTHRITAGGHRMSVAMTGYGAGEWQSASLGYQQPKGDQQVTPLLLPGHLANFAQQMAAAAGFNQFEADSCLINRYAVGSKMTLHQDKNERDLRQPIVSVSLGLPAVFLFGGMSRDDLPKKVLIEHGDVVVWGGASRLCFHGILPVKAGNHPLTGAYRYNLTFRKAW